MPAAMPKSPAPIRCWPCAGCSLQRWSSSALVIVNEQDQATPLAAAQALADHWPGARLVKLPGAAHLANIEQADVSNDAVLDFLLETVAD